MRGKGKHWLPVGILTGSLLMSPTGVGAVTFDVMVNTTSLDGLDATLAFDFFDGGPPSNTVILGTLTSDGTQGATSKFGDVTGNGPWTFSDLGNTSFDNELLVDFTPMRTSLAFSFTATDNPPDGGSSPDSFSFVVLDTDHVTPLITTDEPLGSDALFLFNLGQGTQGLTVYNPILLPGQIFSIEVTPSQSGVPEPSTLALLAAGFGALLHRRRFT
jgi:hypothetical protein